MKRLIYFCLFTFILLGCEARQADQTLFDQFVKDVLTEEITPANVSKDKLNTVVISVPPPLDSDVFLHRITITACPEILNVIETTYFGNATSIKRDVDHIFVAETSNIEVWEEGVDITSYKDSTYIIPPASINREYTDLMTVELNCDESDWEDGNEDDPLDGVGIDNENPLPISRGTMITLLVFGLILTLTTISAWKKQAEEKEVV